MQQSRTLFFHKNIRLPADRYIGQQWYFLTLCCKDRHPVFAAGQRALWLIDTLRQESASMQFSVYAYCVMPDHVHVLVYGLAPTSNLLAFVKRVKQITGHAFHRQLGHDLWQKKFYDHILRNGEQPPTIAGYIWMNPVRKGLCADPRKYPFSGSLSFDWKKSIIVPQPPS